MMKTDHLIFRDDFNRNRLFLRLAQETNLIIHSYTKIKHNLYKILTEEGLYILKGYAESGNLDSIIRFSQLLHKSGFHTGLMYEKFRDGQFLLNEQGVVWVLINYIAPKRKFSFLKEKDREDGLLTLQKFHQHSKIVLPNLTPGLPKENTIAKWQNRLLVFENHVPFLTKWFNPNVIGEIVYYSHLSLSKLAEEYEETDEVVLHGDVVSHNFIKAADNKVYLIDYDLLSVGSADWDYVQYASRILPFLKWNGSLFHTHFNLMEMAKDHPWFWTALSFPMDILREGNQFSKSMGDETMPSSFANLSYFISTWELRKQFLTNYNNLIQ
ncbi:aminoglycoside phosphotransferase family protein [Sutcliffiella horikoshii]|uniref:phosphotransferase n=1 Tax=Sutcliffiella horikoshii TaxID=79883 RepID=UPI001CFE0A5C|nr:phosphotransferase [Sutcliffiella horikoshii]